jgi:hypothetical protein
VNTVTKIRAEKHMGIPGLACEEGFAPWSQLLVFFYVFNATRPNQPPI